MQITRRIFLRCSGAAAAGCALPRTGLLGRSSTPASSKALVVVFLRGGVDVLNLVVPHAEDQYYKLRPTIAVPRPGQDGGALDLDGRFGLHPAATPLMPLFEDGSAVALHAIGWEHNTRSHFVEQDAWETAQTGGDPRAQGWLNRHLATSAGHGPVRAVSLGSGLPRSLRGEAPALALRGLGDLTFGGSKGVDRALREAYGHGEEGVRGLLSREATDALEALDELRVVVDKTPETEVAYPDGDLARQLREGARLLRAGVGLEVLALDFGGWDTHQDQNGPFVQRVGALAGSLAAFREDLGPRFDDVVVLAVTEFGRTAAQNGTSGTDHGHGGCALALGGAVRAAGGGTPRRVIGTWPGLEPEQLKDRRDLAHTTDFRDVLAELTVGHLGNPNLEKVIPDHEPKPVGLI